MYACVGREYLTLDSLSAQLLQEADQNSWKNKSAETKSNIILYLGDAALAKTRAIVDAGDKSSKELWDDLKLKFTTSRQQAITNLQNGLNTITFDEKKSLEESCLHVHGIIDELGAYDQTVMDAEEVLKLIRSLPKSFEPLSIVSNMSNMSFDQFFISVQADTARCKNVEKAQPVADEQTPPYARFARS